MSVALDLDAIKARYEAAFITGWTHENVTVSVRDVPALVAEVERLGSELRTAHEVIVSSRNYLNENVPAGESL